MKTKHKGSFIKGDRSLNCARIERWVLRLQSYKYTDIYNPGKSNIADLLFRLCINNERKTFDSEKNIQQIVESATPIALKLSEILNDSRMDPETLKVKTGIYKGIWDNDISGYKTFQTELCLEKAFNVELQVLTLSFVKQGILKQILTEGEKYVMSVSPVLSFSEQATYDIVNNLGSLAARFIFRPIEDNSYFYFTQSIARDLPLKHQDKERVLEAAQVLSAVTKTVSSIGLMVFTFGQSFAGTVLLLYGGSDFVSGGTAEMLLKWHSLAIYFLAINGITEGYMFATNTSKDIDKYNYFMAVFSILFLLLSYVLTNLLGPVGFIVANCTNMCFRIYYSTLFIYKQYQPVEMNPLKGLLPGKFFFSTLLVMGIVCKTSEMYFETRSRFKHVAIGALCVLLSLSSWALENRNLVKTLSRNYDTAIKKRHSQ